MSVAVSPYLPAHQGLFRDQHSDLLDALLDSCQKSSTNPRLPGYGRTLQPYFDAEASTTSRPMTQAKTPNTAKRTRGRHSGLTKNGINTGASTTSSSDEETSFKIRAARTPFVKYPTGRKLIQPTPNSGSQPIARVASASKEDLKGITWAGPTFGVPPSAIDVPMPSVFLLS